MMKKHFSKECKYNSDIRSSFLNLTIEENIDNIEFLVLLLQDKTLYILNQSMSFQVRNNVIMIFL